jgi:DNA-binding ferritin-like protein (Dps family)
MALKEDAPILGNMGVHHVQDQPTKGGAGMSGLIAYIRRVAREKREFRQMQARAKALPQDYAYMYHKIQRYMWGNAWRVSGGIEMDLTPLFADLLDLFETAAAEGKPVLAVTGEDVAAFCDGLLQNTHRSTGSQGETLNRDIRNKLGKGNGA